MQIMHPQNGYNGLPPQDVFIALDDQGTQVGLGYIIYQYLPARSPECPINMYFEIDSLPAGWYLLLGALVARARQLREQMPNCPARLYTRIEPTDDAARMLYTDSGFDCSPAESLMQLYMPNGDGRVPMSCVIQPTPLNTQNEMLMLLERLRLNDVTHIDPGLMQQLQRMPHFVSLGLLQGQSLAGEIIAAGAGNSCQIITVYTHEAFRRQGMARLMIHRCMAVMASEGVTQFSGTFVGLSEPQMHLARDFGATDLQVRGVFPQLML